VAEAIHALGPWASGPFVRTACSTLDDVAAEAELMANLAAASAGPVDRGTLLLDEIADLSPLVQLRLLRALEERDRERRGDAPRSRRLRLLCTSNRELRALVEAGRFRADLYFRLAVFPLRLPPLRERTGDIALLGEAFLARRVPTPDGRRRRILPAALAALEACPWPGNVRELQNVLEFAALQAGADDVDLPHLPPDVRALVPGRAAMPERAEILAALDACGGNRAAAARRLGISRVTLWKRLKDEERGGPRDPEEIG
jgi:DNA-binding NtrC family response regulator